ncbi:MAG: T9SS type A sorting domain-containing protein [Chitinophagales bacterium]
MRKIMYFFFAMFIASTLFSQTYVERVFILNEGYFDYYTGEIITPVTLGAYDPESGLYAVVDEIENARFASDIKTNGDYYYVAADKYLNKYNIYTDELVNSIEVAGIRKIAVNDNYIVVTRGEYLVEFNSYIQVYDKNTLDFIFEIDTDDLNFAAEGVVIKDNVVYVAVNNGFDFGNEVGYIAKVDLYSQSMTELIDLGADGINPDNLMLDGDDIYTLNNKDYTGSSVSSYKISTGDLTTANLINISSGCGTSAFIDGSIYYQEMFGTSLSKYDPVAHSLISEDEFGLSFYALAYDDLNDLLYTSETDYFSYGKVHIYDMSGDLINSFDVSISPGNIAFDLRTTTSVNTTASVEVAIYPNPVANSININSEEIIREIKITDLSGSIIQHIKNINAANLNFDVSDLIPGNYLTTVITDDAVSTKAFSKF